MDPSSMGSRFLFPPIILDVMDYITQPSNGEPALHTWFMFLVSMRQEIPRVLYPIVSNLGSEFFVAAIDVSDSQITGNGQRVCNNFRFKGLLASASSAKTTTWNSTNCTDPQVPFFLETSWWNSITYNSGDKLYKILLLFSQLIPRASPLREGFQERDDLLSTTASGKKKNKTWEQRKALSPAGGICQRCQVLSCLVLRRSWCLFQASRVLLPWLKAYTSWVRKVTAKCA